MDPLIQLNIFILLTFLLLPLDSLAQCSRDELRATHTRFFNTAMNGSDFPLASGAKISGNQGYVPVFLSSLAQTAHSNITGYYKPYNLLLIDEAECQVASLTVPSEATGSNEQTAILSLRLKLAGPGGLPSEGRQLRYKYQISC